MSEVDMELLNKQLRRQQYRQDLHDEKYHKDIYVLPKPQRLNHLVLHHMKYTSDLFMLLKDPGFPNNLLDDVKREKFLRRSCDGIIVCMSMANICGKFIPASFATIPWTVDGMIEALVTQCGIMAKTIEDIDHMTQTNPLNDIHGATMIMFAVYVACLKMVGIELQDLVHGVNKRLLKVESYNMFHDHYLEWMGGHMANYDMAIARQPLDDVKVTHRFTA